MSGAGMKAIHILQLLAFASVYIVLSAGLINFNKYLLTDHRFPFAAWLTVCHMATTWIMCVLLLQVKPSLFPSMTSTLGSGRSIVKLLGPLCVAFAISMFCANKAYGYCTIAFLQFMKQSNVVTVFLAACLVGSQVCDRMKLVVLAIILAGAISAITGEVKFALAGFLMQLSSSVAEVCNILLKEKLLTGNDMKLDPLSFQIYVCPGCIVVLMIMNCFTYDDNVFTAFAEWWSLLLPNCLVACMLNVCIASIIKFASAYEFVLMGVLKDVVIVCTSTYIMGDNLQLQQTIGFSIATVGIFYWSFMKIFPHHPYVATPRALLGLNDDEASPLKADSNLKV